MTDTPSNPIPEGGDHARVAGRLVLDYVLRSLQLLTEIYGGDVMRSIVAGSIVAANTAHLNQGPGGQPLYPDLENTPPDAERRPISARAVAASLGLPGETVRRHVNELIALGYCQRVKGGVIMRAEVLATPASQEILRRNLANTRQYVRRLRNAGVLAPD